MKAPQSENHHPVKTSFCNPCVYFSGNLDPAKLQSDDSRMQGGGCGLGFIPGDGDCREMRTNNCSARKK